MKDQRPVLLYLFPNASTFVQRDIDQLSAHYQVHAHQLLRGPQWLLPWRLLAQCIWLIRHRAWACDAICHFSGYHAVLPVLLARRCFIILAGADCAGIPWIRYGNHVREPLGRATRFAVRRAFRLLPVHALLIEREQHYDDKAPQRQGLKAFVPDLRTPFTVIPYGFDVQRWQHDATIDRRPDRFVCVVSPTAPGDRVHFLKGVDLITDVASRLPSAHFQVIGVNDPTAYVGMPANLEFLSRRSSDELRSIFSAASFYLQLSLSEGFPNALCEAMLCGCIPIVSDVSSMPGTVEGSGVVVRHRSVEEVTAAMAAALDMVTNERARRSAAARARIVDGYALERRERALLAVLRATSSDAVNAMPA